MSSTSSAQLRTHPDDELAHDHAEPPHVFELTHPEPSQPALKQQAADRVAAHRARRAQAAPDPAAPTPGAAGSQAAYTSGTSRTARVRSANIVAAVAERYAHSQSYRAFLAAEAERAVHQADAAAQVATINAHAIAVAQQQLLADLNDWDLPSTAPPPAVPAASLSAVPLSHVPLSPVEYAALFDREPGPIPARATTFAPRLSPEEALPLPSEAPSLTVRPFEGATHSAVNARPFSYPEARRHNHDAFVFDNEEELADERLALEDEIAFRHDPVFEEISAPEAIAANLIEFPRQLVASRKARPRIAEGPLRDDGSSAPSGSQLRIFEVEAHQLSTTGASEDFPTEWSSILLSALPAPEFVASEDTAYLTSQLPHPAPISLRLMAGLVDACLIVTVQVAFTAVFALALTRLSGEHAALEIPRTMAIAGTLGTLAILTLLYQLLFFSLSDATPGMRYARIGLCTFSDENPTRSAMRRRIFATVLAACPLGFGLLWALLDEDTLGWHDRISRMYQRAY